MSFFKSDWDTEFDKNWKKAERRHSTIWIIVISLIVITILGRLFLFANAKSKGKSTYTIEVHNFQSEEMYFSDSIVSQEPNKIVFLDGFGRKQTITSPGISVTQY